MQVLRVGRVKVREDVGYRYHRLSFGRAHRISRQVSRLTSGYPSAGAVS
jgi:hypothetical protein